MSPESHIGEEGAASGGSDELLLLSTHSSSKQDEAAAHTLNVYEFLLQCQNSTKETAIKRIYHETFKYSAPILPVLGAFFYVYNERTQLVQTSSRNFVSKKINKTKNRKVNASASWSAFSTRAWE